jgi:hypothetical protein
MPSAAISWVAPKKAIKKKSVTDRGKKAWVYKDRTDKANNNPQAI